MNDEGVGVMSRSHDGDKGGWGVGWGADDVGLDVQMKSQAHAIA